MSLFSPPQSEPDQPSQSEPDQPSKPKPSQPSQPKPDVSNNDSDEQLSGGYCSNLADEAFRDISNGVSGNEWVNSIFDPIEGNEMTFTEEDIERIARAVCLDNGTSLDKVAEEIYLALMSQMEGE